MHGAVQNMAISFYVYPELQTSQGNVLSYRGPTGDLMKLSVNQGIFFVSFWDEYGTSVGMTAIPHLIVPQTWNHVVLIREYQTGKILVSRHMFCLIKKTML